MRRFLLVAMAALFVLVHSTVAIAAKGVVVSNKNGCKSRYIVETPMGYAILEWYGGADPMEGETIFGDFEAYGMKTITLSDGREGKVWVEDYGLSQSRVIEKMQKFCG